jgi:hypothetical protein
MKRVSFMLPASLATEFRRVVKKAEQDDVAARALRNELKRLRFRRAFEASFAAWKKEYDLEPASRDDKRTPREEPASARSRKK